MAGTPERYYHATIFFMSFSGMRIASYVKEDLRMHIFGAEDLGGTLEIFMSFPGMVKRRSSNAYYLVPKILSKHDM
jgi:hypothetical protein